MTTILVACSQALYFFFKVHWAHVIKNKNPGGFIDHQSKGLGVGEEDNRWSLFFFLTLCACSCTLADVFKKNEKKKNTMSVYRLQYLSHLLKHFPHYVISKIGSCIMGLQINRALNVLGKKRKSKHREELDDKSVEKAWHEKSSVSVKWFNEIWQVLLCPCSNWKNLKYMGRQQHNVGASNRPASYPRHQHFGLKIGTVSSFYCGHPRDSKLVSATAKVMVEVHFRQNL